MSENCDIENERQRLLELAAEHPTPCVVCGSNHVIGAGTWMPDKRHRLAAGGTEHTAPIFSFCLCLTHYDITEENEKLIRQSVIRAIRVGQRRKA